jgi:LCP family protein required for cell wall assembly
LLGTRGGLIAGKVGYAASCLLAAVVLVVSGYAYKVTGFVSGIASSNAITGGAQTGAMNILLMGLESRTDYEGNTLSSALLTAMHAGSVYGVNNLNVGGQATNTLILIHIFAGGQKAVGYSIPRDDWVAFPHPYDGQSQGKIDQAYGLAWAQSLSANASMAKSQRYFLANEAGQKAAIETVEMVTNQKVDHFAEVNLAGFYSLAQAFGGIEACLKPYNGGSNLQDNNSGFNAVKYDGYNRTKGGSQYLHLSAPQALAFVRERDNLPNGDLDRTHRQQAVLDYVIWKLKNGGILSDLGQLTGLLGTAKKYVITDSSWNLLDFSTQMHALTGQNLKFYTAPIVGFEQINGQDANKIDIPTIQAEVKMKFTAPAPTTKKSTTKAKPKKAAPIPAASTVTVDVYNGSTASTAPLAGQTSAALVALGYKAGAVATATAQSQTVTSGTRVFYGTGASANAAKIANYFGATATALKSLPAHHVEVLLGTGATVVPASLTSASTSTKTPTSSASSSSSSAGNNGAVGGAVTVANNAKYGIPCVF